MNPGIPGTGISGLFYILCALLMPVIELWRAARRGSLSGGQWRLAFTQAAIAAGIVAAMSMVFVLLDFVVLYFFGPDAGLRIGPSRWLPVVSTLGVLIFVLVTMQITRLFLQSE